MNYTTPFTKWTNTYSFNIADFNRLKNNLYYLFDLAAECGYYIEAENMGEDMTSYNEPYRYQSFNAIENNLHKLNDAITHAAIGDKKEFTGGGIFIGWEELNRIETATALIYAYLMEKRKNAGRRIPFRCGQYKEFVI